MQYISISEIKSYQKCPIHHYYRYKLGYRSIAKADSLTFGTMIHEGLEEIYKTGTYTPPQEIDTYDRAKVDALLSGYINYWPRPNVVSTETTFEKTLINPETGRKIHTYRVKGVVDAVLDDAIVEHKTTSQDITDGSLYWQKLDMDPQVYLYLWLTGKQKCIYDVIHKGVPKPKDKPIRDANGLLQVVDASGTRIMTKSGTPRQTGSTEHGYRVLCSPESPVEYRDRLVDEIAQNPGKYYKRCEIYASDRAIYTVLRDINYVLKAMKLNAYHSTQNCTLYNTQCEFFDVCRGCDVLVNDERYVKNGHHQR